MAKVIDLIRAYQPELLPTLERLGFHPFDTVDDEPDPTFDFFDKLMREVPRK